MDETLYESVGGMPFFEKLVEAFYSEVEQNEILRPMYPDDLTDAKRHLVLFIAQYFGGPAQYMEERGHPRLRMRHAPFRITKKARDAWLDAMNAALETLREQISGDDFVEMTSYFDMAAHSLRNV